MNICWVIITHQLFSTPCSWVSITVTKLPHLSDWSDVAVFSCLVILLAKHISPSINHYLNLNHHSHQVGCFLACSSSSLKATSHNTSVINFQSYQHLNSLLSVFCAFQPTIHQFRWIVQPLSHFTASWSPLILASLS